jgi:hypothetical protein
MGMLHAQVASLGAATGGLGGGMTTEQVRPSTCGHGAVGG